MSENYRDMCLFSKIAFRIDQCTRISLTVVIGAATLLMFGQVITRYFFGIAPGWVEETVRYCGVYLSMLALGPVTRDDSFVRVDTFYEAIKKRRWARILLDLFALCCIGILLVKGTTLVKFGMRSRTTGLRIPFGFVYLAIPLGATLALVQLIDRWVREFRS